MKRITKSPAVALGRLVEALAERGIRVELERQPETTHRAIVLRRDGRRRVAFQPHRSRLNLDLLFGIALASPRARGAGMSWAEIRVVTRYAAILPWEEVHAKRVRSRRGR